MKRCPICGAKIEDGLETCPYCGEVIGTGKAKASWTEMVGSRSREEQPEDTNPNKQTYYVDNSSQQPMEPTAGPKKKSRTGLISVILIVVFIAAVGLYVGMGGHGDFEDDPVIVDDAYNQAVDFFNAVYDDAVVLEDTGIDVADAWYEALDSGETDVDKVIDDAFTLHQNDLDRVSDNQGNISYLYSMAVSMADETGETELADAVEKMYNEYFDFYEEVMNTDRSYDEYAQAFNDADDELYNAMQALYDILS